MYRHIVLCSLKVSILWAVRRERAGPPWGEWVALWLKQ